MRNEVAYEMEACPPVRELAAESPRRKRNSIDKLVDERVAAGYDGAYRGH